MTSRDRPRLGPLLLIAVVSLPLGYAVLVMLEAAIAGVWETAAGQVSTPVLAVMVLGIPTLAGVVVAWLRRHGSDGHNPMFGIALNPITAHDYPSVIGAIAVTLVGGLVLGPEVALVSTGAAVGTVIAGRTGIDTVRGATIGAAAAIAALFVGPVLNGSFTTSPSYSFAAADLVGAVAVGAATAGVVVLGRFLAIGLLRLRGGDRPAVLVMAGFGLVVGVVALAYHLTTGDDVALVLTSGESTVKPLLALGSAGAIAITVAAKWLAYALSMAGGFRGGPFFPAIYVGAGIGGIAAALTPSIAQGAACAGVVAAIVHLARTRWAATVVLGALVALPMGGPALVGVGVVAACVAKLLPGVREATTPEGGRTVTRVA